MDPRDLVKLKSVGKDISYPFTETEYNVFLLCVITLLLCCFFSQNNKTLIVLKSHKYQLRNTMGLIAKKEIVSV